MTEMTRGRLLRSVLIGLALTVLALLLGVDWPHSLMFAAVPPVVTVGRTVSRLAADTYWPAAAEEGGDGARREVARLSWALSAGEDTVNAHTVRRLRTLAEHRLRLRGLSLDSPADLDECRRLLGDDTVTVITSVTNVRIRFDRYRAAVEAVRALRAGGSARGGVAPLP